MPNHPWGVASVVSNLIRYSAYPEIRKKVILIGIGSENKPCDKDFGDAEVIVESSRNMWTNSKLSFVRRVARHISENSIIICNDGSPEYSMVELLQLRNPVISILHGDNRHYFNGGYRYGYLIDRMICVSSFLKKKANKLFPSCTNPIFIPFATPHVKINIDQKSYEKPIVITYAGSIISAKGCHHFPELIKQLDQSTLDYRFDIWGDGDLLDWLKKEVHPNSRVKFHGRKANEIVINALKESNISILLSKKEGLPVSLVEAMKCGSIPVVFDLDTGIPDIIDHEINGFRVPQEDVTGICNRILQIGNDINLLKKMSNAAVIKANSLFEPKRQAQSYEDLFLETSFRKEKFHAHKTSVINAVLNRIPMKFAWKIRKYCSIEE